MNTQPSADSTLDQRFERLFTIFNSESFLAGTGMANGVSLFIQPYQIQDEIAHEKRIRALVQRLKAEGREVLHIDLLELVHELMSRDGRLERPRRWLRRSAGRGRVQAGPGDS